jgi:CRP-like cAMP-binding protein
MKYIALAALPQTPGETSTLQDQAWLLRTPLLQNLEADIQQQLQLMGSVRTLRKGEYLFLEGEAISSFHYVITGRIKEYYPAGGGGQCLRRIALPGHYLSLHQLFSGRINYSYSAMAIASARCWSWPTSLFHDLMHREPTLALQVARLLSENVEHSCRHACLCRKSRALSKVAGYLLSKNRQMAQQLRMMGGREPRIRIDLRPLELAAAEICLARETFSRALSCLDERDMIRVEYGVVELLDEEGLKQISAVH